MWRPTDYHYELPEELIAQSPVDRRDESRLLVVEGQGLSDRRFRDIVDLLPADSVLIVNDTRVIPARLRARKESGGAVELLLIEPSDQRPGAWLAMARSSKPLRPASRLLIEDRAGNVVARATIPEPRRADGTVLVELDQPALEILQVAGEVPLPPYIERTAGASPLDRDRYQTVYAKEPGAVAAPTAGLHFTDELLGQLADRGITRASITLHVGLGTFAPVRVDSLRDHRMHSERYDIPPTTAELIASGRPIVAVGTTVVRAVEAAAIGPRHVRPGAGVTDLFIGPEYRFRIVDKLITNFHLPESTLLVLVCAFAGRDRVLSAYQHAVAERYRFFSYGDAMLLSADSPS